ncbi:hypothetical protein K504DRAFT_460514 [Pleomassaria siparia CBS 279.74]|uniref:Autophagy-related protein 14 n=1 Tax=Pleomassaria siparia CBS 279.74 TaxID=1314801 RepID=A0A6G1JYA8_9PLEO|nr:hypothetical protein K504DRAFT_460514 [Pleomassaria siparia CBS 279.74]
MECDICGKGNRQANAPPTPFHCITCARSAIELPRIELVKCLIDRDSVGNHVKAVVQGSTDKASQHVSLADSKGGLLVDRYECTNNVNLQRTKAEMAEIEDRIQLIAEQANSLRKQMEATRKQLEVKRAANAQRKSDFSSVTYGIDSRRANELDKVQQNLKRMDYKSDKVHYETIEMRMYLCHTAAKLAGLKVSKRKTREGGIKDVFSIGPGTRLKIHDLRDMQDVQPDILSASLGAVAPLLVRIAAYLGVRLPAEITVPHNDYPQPTIFPPASSYQGKKVTFPGSTPSHSSSNSPEASRTLEARTQLPKPRTLFLDRPLNHLSAEDPPAYALFIEGITLLAYDIAWLCRTQGLKEEFDEWESVCPMGRNLYRLLISQETRTPPKSENPLDKDIVPNSKTPTMRGPAGLGELSHATSHSFMNTAENVQYLGGWKLTPTKVKDELKAYLLAEQQAQEWDVVNQKEWEDMEQLIAEDPVVVGEKRKESQKLDDGRSYLTSTTTATTTKMMASQAGVGDDAAGEEKKRGSSGWTKVKSRTDE